MTENQASKFWEFARGETDPKRFESWLFEQTGLEAALGDELYLELLSADYRDERDKVPELRRKIMYFLEPIRECECPKIKDLSAVPMGADFYFEKVFETLAKDVEFGEEKWWLYISTCSVCQTHWLIAQDDRIYDDFFMKRISAEELEAAKAGRWPATFSTYENVLASGRKASNPPRFFEKFAASLIWTVQDLCRERPEIGSQEIAYLLGLSDDHAAKLLSKAGDQH
ncbi:MAG: hypothetical protein R3E02_08740 [Blastomonas sp.]